MQVGQEVVKCYKQLYVEVKPDRIFIEGLYPHHILLKLEWDNDNNIKNFKKILKDFPEIQIQSDDKMTYIQTDTIAYATGSHNSCKYDFIMNSDDEIFHVSLPRVYFNSWRFINISIFTKHFLNNVQ